MDFGLARFTDAADSEHTDLTNTGQVMGTVDYISPEQAASTKHADIRSDVFSLGCALFKLITGEVPFEGNSVTEKLFARGTTDARRAKSWRTDLPDELDAVIAKMLEREPGARFQTPIETALALEPFCMTEDAESLRLAEQTATAVVADDAIQEFLGNLAEDEQHKTETFAFTAEAEAVETIHDADSLNTSPPADNRKLMMLGMAGAGVLALLVMVFVIWQATRPTASLVLEIDRPNAVVIVNGGSEQPSPSLRKPMTLHLTHGSHVIVVRKDGYKEFKKTVEVKETNTPLKIRLASLGEKVDSGIALSSTKTKQLPAKITSAPSSPSAPVPAQPSLGLDEAKRLAGLFASDWDEVKAALRHSPDPTLRTALIAEIAASKVDPTLIVERLRAEQDVFVRQALLET
ncbi:MAG: protein kinase, partial [Planctomycetales bacterium]